MTSLLPLCPISVSTESSSPYSSWPVMPTFVNFHSCTFMISCWCFVARYKSLQSYFFSSEAAYRHLLLYMQIIISLGQRPFHVVFVQRVARWISGPRLRFLDTAAIHNNSENILNPTSDQSSSFPFPSLSLL